jgi:hypothetical protein
MQLARKLIISKKGLAIAERGKEFEDDALCKYKEAFDKPLSPAQLEALTTLAKGACRRGKTRATLLEAGTPVAPANYLYPRNKAPEYRSKHFAAVLRTAIF